MSEIATSAPLRIAARSALHWRWRWTPLPRPRSPYDQGLPVTRIDHIDGPGSVTAGGL
jgi:hypothetical protein